MSSKKICWIPNPWYRGFVILFGNRLFIDVIKLRWGHAGFGRVLTQWLVSLWGNYTQRHGDTQGELTRNDWGRDWSDVSRSQGTPRTAGNHQERGERSGQVLLQSLQKEPTPLTPWFQTSSLQNCGTKNFCCFKPPSWWKFVKTALGNKYRELWPLKTTIQKKKACVYYLRQKWKSKTSSLR